MDWVNDKDELIRTLTSKDTAIVITERIKASKAILYVHTNSSMNSKWTPWKLGFAYAIGKPVLVYKVEASNDDPEYLQLFELVVFEDKKFKLNDKNETPLLDWLSSL